MNFVLLSHLLIFLKICSVVSTNKKCNTIIPDAITQLQNGTVVIFEGKNVWFLLLNESSQPIELSGPCPINTIFEGMQGPVDAAVTIETHESVTEFKGASVYFANGNFFTFKNLRPYQVEWGDLVYLAVKGKQSKMGVTVDDAKELMPTKISAAFFDPNSSKSKFIFPDTRVLGYSFELGSEFDIPVVTNMSKELKKFGIPDMPTNITAALTLMKTKQFFFFQGSKYCSIFFELTNLSNQKQSCYNRPITTFFDCEHVKERPDVCAQPPALSIQADDNTDQIPIQTSEQSEETNIEDLNGTNPRVSKNKRTTTLANKLRSPSTTSRAHSLTFCTFYQMIEIFVIFSVIIIF